jgi:H+/gluconate symporter-like permease
MKVIILIWILTAWLLLLLIIRFKYNILYYLVRTSEICVSPVFIVWLYYKQFLD